MTKNQPIITILGSGAWGSALATLVHRNGYQVRLWSRRGDLSLPEAITGASFILSAVSIKGVRDLVEQLQALTIPSDTILITATKGLDPLSQKTPSQIWQTAFPLKSVVVLSGPNLSVEIQQNLPAATTVACTSLAAAQAAQTIFSCDSFRVYINDDPLGTELGGTLKNVMAIAAGVCDGLQLGTNAKSALLTRALPEMVKVGTVLGAKATTFFGLSGLGDLLTTCNSPLSRNYQVGYGLAQGKSLTEVLSTLKGTAEGVNTTNVLIDLAHQQGITVPIAQQVYLLLQEKITPQAAVQALMAREMKQEFNNLDF